jgi:hypothetical protein
LSNQIGRLMAKEGDIDTPSAGNSSYGELKDEVEGLNVFIHESDKKIDELNEEIKRNFMLLPNLLHDRSVHIVFKKTMMNQQILVNIGTSCLFS